MSDFVFQVLTQLGKPVPVGHRAFTEIQGGDICAVNQNTQSSFLTSFLSSFLSHWTLQHTSKASGNAHFCNRFLGECSLST